jgi:nucleolin
MTDRDTGRSKGFGYADVSTGTQTKIVATTDAEFDGRVLRFDGAEQKKNTGGGGGGSYGDKPPSAPSSTLFCGNLPFTATVDGLYEYFAGATNIRLPTDYDSGQIKGFGYVEYASVDDATKAKTELNGMDIDGRACRLDFAGERKERTPGAGGFGGGGRGGGRSGGGGRGGGRGGGGRGGGGRGGSSRPAQPSFSGTKISFD